MRNAGAVAAGFLVAVAMMSGRASAGPKWQVDTQTWMQASVLIQPHVSFVDGAADEEDAYLRRGRLILQGQAMEGVKFFLETDNDNAGRNGYDNVSTDIQDAWVDLQLGQSNHGVMAGLILLPFSLETRASAASLLGLDYNAETVKLVNDFTWRDYGAELHGKFAADRLVYHVGVFDGYETETATMDKNPDADLRLTGHLAANVVGRGTDGGWFYGQNQLGKSSYLTVGSGYDRQDKATLAMAEGAVVPGSADDHEAWVVDFQSSYVASDKAALLLNGAWYDWDNAKFVGNTAFLEGGLLVLQKAMVTAKHSLQDPDGGTTVEDDTVGLHYFMKGHNVRGGVEYRTGDSPDWWLAGLQFLL